MHKEMSLHLVEISWIPIFSPLQDGYFISSQETGESSYPSAVDNKKNQPGPLLCLYCVFVFGVKWQCSPETPVVDHRERGCR